VARWFRSFVALLPWLELLALALIAPLLIFPTLRPAWTAGGLSALALLFLLRLFLRREPWPVTPFNGALLLFTLMIPVAVWASALPELTLPKLTGLILGLAAFRAVAFFVRDRRTLLLALAAFALVGLGIWAVGFLSAGWSTKFAWFAPVVRRLPRALTVLPGSPDSGINANQLAGAVVLYLPVALALAVGWWRERRPTARAVALLAVIAAGLAGGTLALTQSRSGWMGSAAGLAGLVALAGWATGRRRVQVLAVAAPLALIIAAAALIATQPEVAARFINTSGQTAGEISLSGRPEIWSRALYAIQDFSFTGTGLGTFRRVVNLLYPLFTISPDTDIAHAHNIFLQVALDLGLPGLIAYLASLWIGLGIAWGAAKRSSGMLRGLALGLLAGLVALHVYGLTDAIALGAKPGLAFWLALGLIAALPHVTRAEDAAA
jgi:putative inorganic carbon (HCO3(-)) transporter